MNLVPLPLTSFRVDTDTGVIYDADGHVYTGDNLPPPSSSSGSPVTIPPPTPPAASSPIALLTRPIYGVSLWEWLFGALAIYSLTAGRSRRTRRG